MARDADELVLYAVNTGSLYPALQKIQKALLVKYNKGKLTGRASRAKGLGPGVAVIAAFKPWLRRAKVMYAREISPLPFRTDTITKAAQEMASRFFRSADFGELDYLLKKKVGAKRNPPKRKTPTKKNPRSSRTGRFTKRK